MNVRLSIISCIVAAASVLTAPAAENPGQSVGLVLSGGGAKGIAHIGVIQALEDNDIPIDYITGTSMGAIVGSLYAMGYTPDEMLELILSKGFSYWSTGTIDPSLTYYFSRPESTPAMYTLSFGGSGHAKGAQHSVAQSIISPLPMNFAFMELFSAATAQCGGDFDRLFVPYRCVASNITRKRKQVFRSGDLGDCVRSSMSFPIVFQPVEIDSCEFYDGGIYDNFPIDVMRTEFAPTVMLGVDVAASSKGPQTSIFDQLDKLITQTQSYDLSEADGIKLRIHLDEFALLDFPKARAIYDIGYRSAMGIMDSIKSRITARMGKTARNLRRDVFKSGAPYLRFGSVSVSGGTERQNQYIDYIFRTSRTAHSDTMGLEQARKAFYSALSPGMLRDLGVQSVYNDSTGLFDLRLKATVKDRCHAGIGGYITSSANSYIYLNTGYTTLGISSVSASLGGWIGQSYMAGRFDARMNLPTRVPSAIALQSVVSRHKFYENDYLFFEDKMPSFILDNEYFVKLRYSIAAGRRGSVDIGGGYGHLYQSFYDDPASVGADGGRDKVRQDLGQVFATYRSNSLNNDNFPTTGASYTVTAMGVKGSYRYHPAGGETSRTDPRWLQLEGRTRNYLSLSRHWSLGLESDVMLSTRKLPTSYNAALINAPAYTPTPASHNTFAPALRANSFIAAGVVPVYRYNDNLTARASVNCFLPLRRICLDEATGAARHGRWLSDPQFYGEFSVAYTLPFGSISGYCNYTPGPGSKWSGGVSFGIFMLAPKFLR